MKNNRRLRVRVIAPRDVTFSEVMSDEQLYVIGK